MEDIARHYSEVASSILNMLDADAQVGRSSCCDMPMTGSEASALYLEDAISNLPQAARAASRGCGDPIAVAGLVPGEHVLDLGSGGGIDALIASRAVGPAGHVYGVDMTPEMIELARSNAAAAECYNVEFLEGNIQDIPLPDACVDVVVSNCVVNLADSKSAVFSEAYRVLRPGGRLVVSDIVRYCDLDPEAFAAVCRITGCRNGMLSPDEYAKLLESAGFAQASLRPKTAYTLAVLEEKAQRKGRMESFELIASNEGADGASGSAIVTAVKKR